MGRYISKPVRYVGLYPCLEPATITNHHYRSAIAAYQPGFSQDGDTLQLDSATLFRYYNSAHTTQWTITVSTDINASATHYCGFTYDPVDDLVYGVAQNSSSPYTLYTFSINSAGTVTNIGNAAPAGNTQFKAFTAPDEADNAILQRQVDGTGNLLLIRGGTASGAHLIEIDPSDGSISSEDSNIEPATAAIDRGTPFITKNGYYIRGFFHRERSAGTDHETHYSHLVVQITQQYADSNKEGGVLLLPIECLGIGAPYAQTNTTLLHTQGLSLTNWNGLVTPFWGDTSDHVTPIGWDQDDFDWWVGQLLRLIGVAV